MNKIALKISLGSSLFIYVALYKNNTKKRRVKINIGVSNSKFMYIRYIRKEVKIFSFYLN